jgi:hypothetical protein
MHRRAHFNLPPSLELWRRAVDSPPTPKGSRPSSWISPTLHERTPQGERSRVGSLTSERRDSYPRDGRLCRQYIIQLECWPWDRFASRPQLKAPVRLHSRGLSRFPSVTVRAIEASLRSASRSLCASLVLAAEPLAFEALRASHPSLQCLRCRGSRSRTAPFSPTHGG